MNASPSHAAAQDDRLMQASDWVLRLQANVVDEATTAQWLAWCQSDAENLAAFERARSLWHTFDDARLSTSLALEVATAPAQATARPARASRRWAALAASLVLTVGAAAWFFSHGPARAPYSQMLATPAGVLRQQTLPDGSSVDVGARSTLRVELTRQQRQVTLLDDGEAFFTVARDASRPFVVRAGALQVTAIGTAFNVRKSGDRVVVTVTEGVVQVAPDHDDVSSLPAEPYGGQVRAGAGHQVIYSAHQHALAMTAVQSMPAAQPAWLTGRLEFVNEPLGSVIADINRYSSRPVVLADGQLQDLVFTGTLRGDAIEDWLRGLEDVFPVKVIEQGEGLSLRARR